MLMLLRTGNQLYFNNMNKLIFNQFGEETLIDFSRAEELDYWSAFLSVRPERLKTAARACCSNAVVQIMKYLNRPNRTT